jgi:tryptophan synthase alpha chain
MRDVKTTTTGTVMSRISQTFERLRRDKKKALIPFITAGYPDLPTTRELIFEFEKCGADLLELGVPFSDPMADGPLIQCASEQSLAQGTSLHDVLLLVATVRRSTSIPIILMGYYNPFFQFGLDQFTRQAARAGVDGVLVVDLPPEEADEMKRHTDGAGLDLIFLLAPTSGPGRVDRIVRHASGFLYYVSLTGVTGVRSTLDRTIRRQIATIRKKSSLPISVGFGISTPEHAKTVGRWSDAVVVGSAIIKIISECTSARETLQKAGHFIRTMKRALP